MITRKNFYLTFFISFYHSCNRFDKYLIFTKIKCVREFKRTNMKTILFLFFYEPFLYRVKLFIIKNYYYFSEFVIYD